MKKNARNANILKRLRKRFAPRLITSSSKGQSTTEYILILAVVVMIALKFKKTFNAQLKNVIAKLGTDIEDAANTDDP